MIHPIQLREEVRRILMDIREEIPYNPLAEDLLLLTAAHESHLGTYLRQTQGPALGIFQMEPDTYEDLRINYLSFRWNLWDILSETCVNPRDPENLVTNLRTAVVAARLQYYRVPEAIPNTLEELADYAKKYWNTEAGAATSADYLKAYKEAYNID